MTKLTDSTLVKVQKSVTRGAKTLDKKVPDWFKNVRITKLRMANGEFCVIGQIKGDYDAGLFELTKGRRAGDDERVRWAIRHGFNAPFELEHWEQLVGKFDASIDIWCGHTIDEVYSALKRFWITEIRDRRVSV